MVAINYAKDIRVGEQPVKAAALGSNFVWPPLPERLFFRGQSLVYDFIRQRYGVRLPDDTIDYTTNVNDLGIVTRASTATYWGPEGSLLEAAVDEARIQHDPVTGKALGLLVESEATNSLYPPWYSNFIGQYQTENNITVTGDAAQAPDGTQTAVLVEATDVGGVDELSFRWAHSGQGFARSVFIKPVGNIKVIETRASRSRPWIAYNVETGETSYSNDFITHFGREPIVEASKSGWIRLEGMTRNPDAGGYWSMVYARPLEGELSEGDGVLVWGTQDEAWDWEGQKPFTSYIPAISSSATRAADDAVIDLSDVLNPVEGTLRITAQVPEGGVVASLGDRHVISDSNESKAYDLRYIFHTENAVAQLGEGIFSKVEYFPAMQGESELGELIRTLFGNGEQGVMYVTEPKVLGQQVLWQDVEGTVPVMSDGDPVGLMLDLSGNGHHASQAASAARPIYRTDGVLHWLEADGVDDFLTTHPVAPIPVSSFGMTAILANEPTRGFVRLGQYDTPDDRVFSFGTSANLNTLQYNFSVQKGDSFSSSLAASITAPRSPHIATGEWQGEGENRLRINGGVWVESPESLSSRTASGDQGIDIFRTAPGDVIGEGRVYGVVIRRGYLQALDLEQAEKYLATLAGVSL